MAAARITSITLMARPPVTDLAGSSSTTSLANQSCSVAQLLPSRRCKHKPHQSACLSQNQSPSVLSSSEGSFKQKLQFSSLLHPRNAAFFSFDHVKNSHLNDPRNSLLHHPENLHLNDPRNSHLPYQLELHSRAQHHLQYVCRHLYSIPGHPDFISLCHHLWSLLKIFAVLLVGHAIKGCSIVFAFLKWPAYDAQHPGSVKCSAADNSNGRTTQSKPSEMVVCFGEMLIDFVPTVGGLSLADAPAFKKAPGGAPANVAVGIARLGGNSAFMGKVGDDEFGYMLVDILKENRVESRGVRFDPGARTALAFVTLREDGEREFMFYRNPSADMLLDIPELDVELIQQATILHYGSISLIAEPCRSAHLKAMEIARNAGVLLSYDPNLRLPLWPSAEAAREGIKSIWDEADIIKISEEEITFLTEGGDPYSDEAAMSLWHPNLKLLLVTEGADGCRYYTKKHSGRVDGLSVTPVDTTGAGDAFVGGLLTAIVRDLNLYEDEAKLREALKFANACGAIATTERGAIPALPDRDTVMRLISNVTV